MGMVCVCVCVVRMDVDFCERRGGCYLLSDLFLAVGCMCNFL